MNNSHARTARRHPLLRISALLIAVAFTLLISGCPSLQSAADTTEEAGCDVAAVLDDKGNVVLPDGATEIEAPVDVDEDMGPLADLYSGLDTTTDAFYPQLQCEPSIGGTLPAEELPSQDELDAEAYIADYEATRGQDIVSSLTVSPMPAVSLLDPFTVGDCFMRTPGTDTLQPVKCDSSLFLDSNQPFEGRDLIYVHGLAPEHLKDKLKNPPSAMGPVHPSNKVWPQDASEFLNAGGYFRTYAENAWKDHIVEHLGMGWQWTPADTFPVYTSKANRYLLVSWSSNQTIEFAQHALLTQIQLAMTTNKNVVTPPGYPAAYERPFCSNGCIVITHSTGSPITSTAMSLAQAGHFGAGGAQIPKYMAAHVSFAGAISGSRLASVSMTLAGIASPYVGYSNLLCLMIDSLFDTTNTCNADTTFIATSIMRDLQPGVMQGVWGPWVDATPIPTVTFAGGHPIGGFYATGFMLPGIDDGVVTMNSACGNPNPVFPDVTPPSGLTVTSLVKAFDMSEDSDKFLRASKVFINQKNLKAPHGDDYLAGTCTPYLSPTGMVMPVANAFAGSTLDARKRYNNHYSFVQSLAEHSYDGGSSTGNPWPSAGGDPLSLSMLRQYMFFATFNLEESSAVTDNGIYTRTIDGNGTHLVKPIGSHEFVRGRKISFNMPFNIGGCKKKGPLNYYCQRWIWKRTYHLLDKGEKKQSSHYAYEFVGRR